MRHVTAITVRCANEKCENLYQISLSSNPDRHEFEILFAQCPHCRQARDLKMLIRFWGKPRCWSCQIPFDIIPEYAFGMCYADYTALWKQKGTISKEGGNATLAP